MIHEPQNDGLPSVAAVSLIWYHELVDNVVFKNLGVTWPHVTWVHYRNIWPTINFYWSPPLSRCVFLIVLNTDYNCHVKTKIYCMKCLFASIPIIFSKPNWNLETVWKFCPQCHNVLGWVSGCERGNRYHHKLEPTLVSRTDIKKRNTGDQRRY